MKSFQTINSSDYDLQKLQDNTAKAFKPLTDCPLLDGVLIESVSLTSGRDNMISHTLGRVPRLWIVAKKDQNSTVWEKTSPAPSSLLNLWCSTSCTVNLWVA